MDIVIGQTEKVDMETQAMNNILRSVKMKEPELESHRPICHESGSNLPT